MARTVSKNGEYYAVYKNFGGMDVTDGEDKHGKTSFAYTENMYRDYEGDFPGAVESIPGFRTLANFRGSVHSVFMQKCSENEEYIVVHAGTSLFRFNINDRDSLNYQSAIASLANSESHAFQVGNSLYVCDGEKILKIAPDGQVLTVGANEGTAYTPTLFKNGKPYEQRNLLTRSFKELFVINEYDKYYRASQGLKYELADNGTCRIIGLEQSHEGKLYIPKYATLGEKYYKITEIADNAFVNHNGITEAYIADGLTRIGKLAFSYCTSLTLVYCPSTIELIDNGAFLNCSLLTDVFIGRNISTFGMLPFSGAYSLETLKFEADDAIDGGPEGFDQISALAKEYSVRRPDNYYRLPVFTPCQSVNEVTLNGAEITFEHEEENGKSSIYFIIPSDSVPEGKSALITGTARLGGYCNYDEGTDFISRSGNDEKVIAECRTSAFFDGRIFVAGNPKYPNTVFYTLKGKNHNDDSLYFGSLAYFDDGMSAYETVSLTPTSDALAVLKARDDGGGGIFYHESKDGGDFLEKTYPVLNIHTGINVKSKAVSFFDEVFFLSDMGASALKKSSGGAHSVSVKSEKVNSLLLKAMLHSEAHLTSWQGYTVIQLRDEIFLADARVSGDDLDWYRITGVGTYKNGRAKSYYSEFAPSDLSVHENAGALATGQIYLLNEEEFGGVYYVRDGAVSYSVYLTGETDGGTFYPASCIFSDGKLLFFGTESGDLCLFNTDKRGVAPNRIMALADFDAEDYALTMGNRIHPDFYGFSGRAPKYTVLTKPDDANIPYFKKDLIFGSLSLELGSLGSKNTVCEITADSAYKSCAQGLSERAVDFHDFDFSAFTFEAENINSVTVTGGPKSYRALSISVSSSLFCSPIAVFGMSYRYKIKGKLTRK